jgi:hypothetical protein
MYIHFAVKDAHVIHTCGLRHENAYRSVCICESVLERGYWFSSWDIFLGSVFISSSILLKWSKNPNFSTYCCWLEISSPDVNVVCVREDYDGTNKTTAPRWSTKMSEHTLQAFMYWWWRRTVLRHHIYALMDINWLKWAFIWIAFARLYNIFCHIYMNMCDSCLLILIS